MRPQERVIFDADRDANPYFSFFESLWMLHGDNDVEFVSFFNSGMRNYSDDGTTFNAAYGNRWRKHFGVDQLDQIIKALDANPGCRRQVLGMWDVVVDLGNKGRDLPCNTQAYFQIDLDGKLQMMVCNRSNDLIWGAYGANAVHFSFLQEYIARGLGREQGMYYQTSFNTHYYTEPHQKLVEILSDKTPQPPEQYSCPYSDGRVEANVPLMSIPRGRWDRELDTFFQLRDAGTYVDPFFTTVAVPLYLAYVAFKSKTPDRFERAFQHVGQCAATDWNLACQEWLLRRQAKCATSSTL